MTKHEGVQMLDDERGEPSDAKMYQQGKNLYSWRLGRANIIAYDQHSFSIIRASRTCQEAEPTDSVVGSVLRKIVVSYS
jgi:hypothetical protein